MEMFDLFYCMSFAAMLWSVMKFLVNFTNAYIAQKGNVRVEAVCVLLSATLFVLMNRI